MYYRLNDDYALRAWKFVNHVVYHRYSPNPIRVDEETFELLRHCDGEHDLEESSELKKLAEQGVIASCEKGEQSSEWSRYKKYEHRCVPEMNLMLTGKCNYNCIHCFNSADNVDRMGEWDYDELLDFFDQAADCGIHSITLTGGEPMFHPRFNDIVRAIYERNMVLEKLTTNGFFIKQDTLDLFKELNAKPEIKISFDGVGYHDWMRGGKGAEEDAMRAFRLCADNGFRIFAQTQVNRRNLASMKDTIRMLEDIGVTTMRIIRTTYSLRLGKTGPEVILPIEDYFSEMLDLAEWYMKGDHKMNLIFWLYLMLFPKEKSYKCVMDQRPDGSYRPTAPVCAGNRKMMAVSCEGNVIPCLQMCDYLAQRGQTFDSLKERRLTDILQSGKWLDAVCKNHYWLRQQNKMCDACEWFGHCGGGCRMLGILDGFEQTGEYDYSFSDPLACLFFKGGWYDRVKERLNDYEIKGAIKNENN